MYWSNLYLKHALSFSIHVNVTESAYNAAGTPILFNAQSSLATICTADAVPKSVKVKQSWRGKKEGGKEKSDKKKKPNIW